ncbi:ATP-binding protein [Streptomyces sp. NPDC048290]|uniref:ATP-binding protein n=1 Tax=Streptomyces sp. NPDC048290 TaxID=3155811 RepID=UPI00342500A8
MDQRIEVTPRDRGAPPRQEDRRLVGVLRRIAAAKLRYAGLSELMDDVTLVLSELVTNSLCHSGTRQIQVVLTVRNGFLVVEVIDGIPGDATPVTPVTPSDEIPESGRGLLLVQATAAERHGAWGTSDGGARTWCRLAVPEEGAAG